MSVIETAWKYADDAVVESDALQAARRRSLEWNIAPLSPAVLASIVTTAAAAKARQLIEVGTGVGVSALALLENLAGSTITSIDAEPMHQQAARQTLTEAGIAPTRTRLITGAAQAVLPRMSDASYDLVLLDGAEAELVDYLEHALRIVRPGGVVAIPHVLRQAAVANPAKRDAATSTLRTLIAESAASAALTSSVSSVGDGLLTLVTVE